MTLRQSAVPWCLRIGRVRCQVRRRRVPWTHFPPEKPNRSSSRQAGQPGALIPRERGPPRPAPAILKGRMPSRALELVDVPNVALYSVEAFSSEGSLSASCSASCVANNAGSPSQGISYSAIRRRRLLRSDDDRLEMASGRTAGQDWHVRSAQPERMSTSRCASGSMGTVT
jgi:hypothetical protein